MTGLELLGIAGLDDHENETAVRIDARFRWPMFVVALWIPLQWHYLRTGVITHQTDILLSWIIWGMFVVETAVMSCVVNDYKIYMKRNWMNLFIIFTAVPLILIENSAASAMLRLLRLIIVPKEIIKWWNHDQ